jgi:hypothetical protein
MDKNFEKLKKAFVEVLKNPNDVDPCNFCKNKIVCKKKECPKYCSGIGDAEGKFPTMKWTCEDFNFGTCEVMEHTPCDGCIFNDYSGFELNLDMLDKKNIHEHNISYEEDDFLPTNDSFVNVDVFIKCGCQITFDELKATLYNRYGFVVIPDSTYGISLNNDCTIFSVKIDKSTWKEKN